MGCRRNLVRGLDKPRGRTHREGPFPETGLSNFEFRVFGYYYVVYRLSESFQLVTFLGVVLKEVNPLWKQRTKEKSSLNTDSPSSGTEVSTLARLNAKAPENRVANKTATTTLLAMFAPNDTQSRFLSYISYQSKQRL